MPDILVTRDKGKQKADEACLYYKLGACKAVINNLASKQKKQQNNLVDAPFSSVKLLPTLVLRARNRPSMLHGWRRSRLRMGGQTHGRREGGKGA